MRVTTLSSFLLCLLGSLAAAQDARPAPQTDGAKVCVATVANASPTQVMLDRLTQRLATSLKGNKVQAVILESATTMHSELRPTLENGAESKQKDCDYILLTQIRGQQHNPVNSTPQISIGGRVPSVDASDPLGGESGPVYRDNMEIRFALFPMNRPDADLEATLLERPSSSPTDSFVQGMDREANRIGREWKKRSRHGAGDTRFLGAGL